MVSVFVLLLTFVCFDFNFFSFLFSREEIVNINNFTFFFCSVLGAWHGALVEIRGEFADISFFLSSFGT